MTDDLYLTREECRLLSTRLRELASWVIAELDATICRQVAYADPLDTPVRSSDDEANVFNEHASNVAHDVHGTLRKWVKHVCGQRQLAWPGESRASGYATWIDRHLIDLSLTEEAGQAFMEITDSWKQAKKAIDRPAPMEFAGVCQSDLPGVTCDGVYVRPGTDTVTCQGCGVACDVQKMQMQMRDAIADRLYQASELATALTIVTGEKVTFERVRNWIRRDQLVAVADQHGQALYRLTDAQDLFERKKKLA